MVDFKEVVEKMQKHGVDVPENMPEDLKEVLVANYSMDDLFSELGTKLYPLWQKLCDEDGLSLSAVEQASLINIYALLTFPYRSNNVALAQVAVDLGRRFNDICQRHAKEAILKSVLGGTLQTEQEELERLQKAPH